MLFASNRVSFATVNVAKRVSEKKDRSSESRHYFKCVNQFTVISKIIWLFKTNHSTILQALLISSGKGTNEVFSVCRSSLFFSYWAGYSPSTIVTAFSCSASAEPFVLIATCQTYRQDTMFLFLEVTKIGNCKRMCMIS